ncbi:hypothetical protein Tco_0526071 [Tanacetum coccineum]
MTKSYCLMQLSYVRLNIPSTNKSFQAPHDPSLQQQVVNLFHVSESDPYSIKCGLWLGDVELFLITLYSKLYIFDPFLNDETSSKHAQWNYQINNVIAREVEELVLNMK